MNFVKNSMHINSNFTVQTPCLPFFIAISKLFKFPSVLPQNSSKIYKINKVSTQSSKMLKINSVREFCMFRGYSGFSRSNHRSKKFPFQRFQIAFALPFPTSDKNIRFRLMETVEILGLWKWSQLSFTPATTLQRATKLQSNERLRFKLYALYSFYMDRNWETLEEIPKLFEIGGKFVAHVQI